ncbi:MAG: tetratricopeptide repeat protein [Syntrophales bacterium]|jgi:tetratricopeptide (TPR) repeat protein
MHKLKAIHRDLIICFFLVMVTAAVFWQVSSFDFVRYDDDKYVTENHHVKAGLTRGGIAWAFLCVYANNWHPLTWLSHMLDCRIFAANPAGHHLTNLFFHIINTLLLFFILKRMTDFPWRSAFVAALFAIHPLHIESVAWVAERKDVLSTLFFMLTIWAYVRYVERPGIYRYLAILLFFALGLMSKPMLVTLPFVLLLLDFWPLGRLHLEGPGFIIDPNDMKAVGDGNGKKSAMGLIIEKIPLFILSGASICVTLFAQWSGIAPIISLQFSTRISNALVSYISYVGKMIWPHDLAVFYPYPEIIPLWQVGGASLLLVLITGVAMRLRRRYAYVITGWLWYLGTLVPVIGLVQVGYQSMADRYTYLPMIGLFIAIAWTVPDLLAGWRFHRIALIALAVCVIAALMTVSLFQIRYWQNSMTLFARALSVTKNNFVIENNMGASLAELGKFGEAITHYQEALKIKPDDFESRYNLANALARQGKMEEAVSHYAGILQTQPDSAAVHNNMGIALSQLGRNDEAIVHFREAIRIKPDFQDAGSNLEKALMGQTRTKKPVPEKMDIQPADPNSAEGQLRMGLSLFQEGRADEAIPKFEEALRLNPKLVAAHISLGLIMAQKRDLDKAIEHFRKALKIKPDIAEVHNSLGVALTYKGALEEAVEHFETALKINPKFAKAHNSLAVALAQKGRTDEAISHLRKALQLQPDYEEAKRNLNVLLNVQGKLP